MTGEAFRQAKLKPETKAEEVGCTEKETKEVLVILCFLRGERTQKIQLRIEKYFEREYCAFIDP